MSKSSQNNNLVSLKTATGNSLFGGGSSSTGSAFTTAISTSDTTQSTSTTTGALIVAGGAGIAKNVYVGGNLNVTGSITGGSIGSTFTTPIVTTDVTNSTSSTSTASLQISGGASVAKSIFAGIAVTSPSFVGPLTGNADTSTAAVNLSGGSVTTGTNTLGGVDVINATSGNTMKLSSAFSGGAVAVTVGNTGNGSVTAASFVGPLTGAVTGNVTGNLTGAVAGTTGSFSGKLTATEGINSLSYTTGSVVVTGGVGISQNTFINGNLTVAGTITGGGSGSSFTTPIITTDTTASSSSTSAASLQINGGASIAKNIYVGTTGNFAGVLTAAAATASTNSTNGALVVTGGLGVAGAVNFGSILTVNDGVTTTFTTASDTTIRAPVGNATNIYGPLSKNLAASDTAGNSTLGDPSTTTTITGSTLTIVPNEIRSSTAFPATSSLQIPLSLTAGQSIDVRFSLQCSTAPVTLKIYSGTVTNLLDCKTTEANGVAVLSGAVASDLTLNQLNVQIQTFTITVARDASYYLFYMNGVMFNQVGTCHACTFAGYANAPQTQFTLAPSTGTIAGFYRTSKFT